MKCIPSAVVMYADEIYHHATFCLWVDDEILAQHVLKNIRISRGRDQTVRL